MYALSHNQLLQGYSQRQVFWHKHCVFDHSSAISHKKKKYKKKNSIHHLHDARPVALSVNVSGMCSQKAIQIVCAYGIKEFFFLSDTYQNTSNSLMFDLPSSLLSQRTTYLDIWAVTVAVTIMSTVVVYCQV